MAVLVFDVPFRTSHGDDFSDSGATSNALFGGNQWKGLAIYNSTPTIDLATLDGLTTLGTFDSFETANRLLYFTSFEDGNTAFDRDVTFPEQQKMTTYVKAADVTGTATQFIIFSGNGLTTTNPSGSGMSDRSVMSGTIGTTPAGGDMVIADTSIVAGNEYTVNWSMTIFDDHTF